MKSDTAKRLAALETKVRAKAGRVFTLFDKMDGSLDAEIERMTRENGIGEEDHLIVITWMKPED
jgi:hypothetical protein